MIYVAFCRKYSQLYLLTHGIAIKAPPHSLSLLRNSTTIANIYGLLTIDDTAWQSILNLSKVTLQPNYVFGISWRDQWRIHPEIDFITVNTRQQHHSDAPSSLYPTAWLTDWRSIDRHLLLHISICLAWFSRYIILPWNTTIRTMLCPKFYFSY